jgi:hypothetical protein
MDDISPKQMDALEERARQLENYALSNARNNSPDYVASRYIPLHAAHGYPVPVRNGVEFNPPVGRLFPLPASGKKRKEYGIRSAHPAGGIIVSLLDENTGEVRNYHVESNGLNGVEVTGRVE